MEKEVFEIEGKTAFSESLIWQLNREFYDDAGINAWSEGLVPHQMTSNSNVGKTYALLVFALMKDRAAKGKTDEIIYLL